MTKGTTYVVMRYDDLYYELCVFDDQSLFGVPDEIMDVTWSLAMAET